jgi:hypothetical protein
VTVRAECKEGSGGPKRSENPGLTWQEAVDAREHPFVWGNQLGIRTIIAGDFNLIPSYYPMYNWDDIMWEGHYMNGACWTHVRMANPPPPPYEYKKIDYVFSHMNHSTRRNPWSCTPFDHPTFNGYHPSAHFYITGWFNY